MAKAKKPIETIPFTNELGQLINPGAQVIVSTSAYKSTRVRKGVFLGQRRGRDRKRWKWDPAQNKSILVSTEPSYNLVVQVEDVENKLVHKETGVEWNWNSVYKKYEDLDPEQERQKRLDMIAERDRTHEWRKIPIKKNVTLKRNRMYLLATDPTTMTF